MGDPAESRGVVVRNVHEADLERLSDPDVFRPGADQFRNDEARARLFQQLPHRDHVRDLFAKYPDATMHDGIGVQPRLP